jgi:diguanylate cyclase (GGDEF)-like protein
MERSGSLVAVLALDLDHFKSINDILGHGAGDEFLMAVSHRLKSCVRRMDTIARVGSDEFTIVIEGVENESDVDGVCAKISAALAEPIPIRGQQIALTVSIGMAFWPLDGLDANDLLRNADTAMFRAKTMGGGQVCRFSAEFNQTLNETARLAMALRDAIADGALQLYYQPKLSLQTGSLSGVEALLRWHHPELGDIPPARFIPLAEENGLIVQIGEWVLRQACCDMRRWEALGFEEFSVAVNLSPRQFSQGDFSVLVQQILEETAIDPNQLVFEITENVLMEDTEISRVQLDALKALGVMVYLDDFGTGYSSLAYLKRFRIDGLKIDSSFVRDIGTDSDDTALTGAIIALGRALHLGVVAEGVETEAQLNFLREEGCDEVQGFLFSKALPYDEFVQWLSSSVHGEVCTRVGTN